MDSQLNRKSNKNYQDGLPKKIRIEQNRWEYEQICKSLRDCRCDDAINILLADTKELRSSGAIPFIESLTTERHQEQQEQRQQQQQQLNEHMNASSNAVMLPPSPTSATKNRRQALQPTSAVRPKRDSVIMNLDKNRINVKRNKLLPRPLSLPNSLKLFRNTFGDHHHHQRHQASVNERCSEKIDLDFIKQLEDDIYRTKTELYNECEEKVVPKQLYTKTCYECNQVISTPSFEPNQITDQKMIEFKLSHFNKRQHAVLLLDAWQLQPMTMLRENNEPSNFCGYQNEREKLKNKQYVVIVDNSSYYPVFMSYEIGKQKPDLLTDSNKPVTCKCMDDAYSNDFTRIFRNSVHQLADRIQNAMPNISPNGAESSALRLSSHYIPVNYKSVKICYPSVHRSSSPPLTSQLPLPLPLSLPSPKSTKNYDNDIKTKKKPFENLLKNYSRPYLKNFMRKRKTKKQHTLADVNPVPISSPALPLPTKMICTEQISNSNSSNVKQIFTEKNQKLQWILHTKPKIEEFRLRLRQRPRSYSTTMSDEFTRKHIFETIGKRNALCDSNKTLIKMPNDYADEFCQLFHGISWSCSDLLDINRAANLRVMYLNREENVEKNIKNKSTNQVYSNLYDTAMNKKRKTDRSVSFRRLKRHSIGSNSAMTDTVKAWVYRRRC